MFAVIEMHERRIEGFTVKDCDGRVLTEQQLGVLLMVERLAKASLI